MAFIPVEGYEGKNRQVRAANSTAFTKGDACVDDGTGYITTGTSSSQNVPYVAMETVTTTSAGELVNVILTEGVIFEADTDAAVAQTDVGTLCDLFDKDQLNPDASTHDVFEIIEIVGAAGTATKVRGKFRMQSDA
ncbi:MAG: hypothetical protein ACOZAL_01065 [Patescibacteria group bacterium]